MGPCHGLDPMASHKSPLNTGPMPSPVEFGPSSLLIQHDDMLEQFGTEEEEHAFIESEIMTHVIEPIIPAELIDSKTDIIVNGTGRFVQGGPHADAGITGRKIIVDTYGGMGRHGGGAFSGKDPSKVDRSPLMRLAGRRNMWLLQSWQNVVKFNWPMRLV